MSARWRVTEDADTLVLHVSLWNGHHLVLTAWRDDAAPPLCALRDSKGAELYLAQCTATDFRVWLDRAQGRQR
jgi:hypothetical protein